MRLNAKTIAPAVMGVCISWAAIAASGDGQGQREGRPRAGADACGSELKVVLPDGTEQDYRPAQGFFQRMSMVEIDQGEQPRPAIQLEALLSAVGADWVKVLDCRNLSQDFPSGLPVEGPVYLVVTGRGSLKIVRESRPGHFVNLVQSVQRLRFHRSGVRPQNPPAPAKK